MDFTCLQNGQAYKPIHVENPEFQTRWYFKYFIGRVHQNYVGIDSDGEAFVLSVILTDAEIPQYKAILWRKKVCFFIPLALFIPFIGCAILRKGYLLLSEREVHPLISENLSPPNAKATLK